MNEKNYEHCCRGNRRKCQNRPLAKSDLKLLMHDCESPAFGTNPGLCTPKARLRGFFLVGAIVNKLIAVKFNQTAQSFAEPQHHQQIPPRNRRGKVTAKLRRRLNVNRVDGTDSF